MAHRAQQECGYEAECQTEHRETSPYARQIPHPREINVADGALKERGGFRYVSESNLYTVHINLTTRTTEEEIIVQYSLMRQYESTLEMGLLVRMQVQ